MERWLKELRDNSDPNIVIMLLGNKSDLGEARVIKEDVGLSYAGEQQLFFMETSALDSSNVEEAFKLVIKEIYERATKEQERKKMLATGGTGGGGGMAPSSGGQQ